MQYTIAQIASIVRGEIIQIKEAHLLTKVLLDTRRLVQPYDGVFIAIAGEHHDSHQYLEDAYLSGVRAFIVEKEIELNQFSDANIVRVDNSVLALQQLAAYHRARFDVPVMGITGSNGKTIVKEWLNTLLADDFIIVRSPRSYNSQVGVPLSVLNMEPHHTLGIFEAGISKSDEMHHLSSIVQPTMGIMTNVGSAHMENFSSREKLAEEKARLFIGAKSVVYCADYAEVHMALHKLREEGQRLISWSLKGNEADYRVERKSLSRRMTALDIQEGDNVYHFSIAMTDDASVENALHCIITLLELDYTEEEIQQRLERLAPLAMRLELLHGIHQSTLINDVYSSDMHSLQIALDFMQMNSQHRKKVVILSDMLQTGLVPLELYKKVNALLVANGVDHFIGIGRSIVSAESEISVSHEFYESTDAFIQNHNLESFRDSIVLIKGAREFQFEQITDWLQERTHDTVLEINLNAIAHNLHYYRSKIKPSTKLMVMIKASGYGSGSYEIASLLEFNKVDYLTVAYTDEGVALRKAGISVPIMIMNPERSSLPTLIRYKLEPEIYSFRTLENFLKELPEGTKSYPVHLKVDTGMHRLGFLTEEVEQLIQALKQTDKIRVASVFTHLATADDPAMDDYTKEQLNKFSAACEALEQGLQKSFLRHALNTAGIMRFGESQMDMVRLGIGLYGISPLAEESSVLQPVSTLRTVISQIKNIPAGESVGYSRKFIAPKDMRTATIPLGYADGLRRALGNGKGYVLIRGQQARIVGNVCMDMIMVDVTDIACAEGDRVEIFGPNLPIQKLAQWSDTIPYEVIASISERVKRIYLQE
jgi:alanine racemase